VLQQPQYRGKALPPDHPDAKLVQKVADRIIGAVEQQHGSGFQKHIAKFDWEVRARACGGCDRSGPAAASLEVRRGTTARAPASLLHAGEGGIL
jgi:hypothetical protein